MEFEVWTTRNSSMPYLICSVNAMILNKYCNYSVTAVKVLNSVAGHRVNSYWVLIKRRKLLTFSPFCFILVSVIITVIIYGKEDLYGLSEIQPSAGIYQRVSDDTYRSSYGWYRIPSAAQDLSNISLGTVYRNLALLADIGEIQKICTGDGADRFDGQIKPHYPCDLYPLPSGDGSGSGLYERAGGSGHGTFWRKDSGTCHKLLWHLPRLSEKRYDVNVSCVVRNKIENQKIFKNHLDKHLRLC